MTRAEEYYHYCTKVEYETYQHEGQPCIEDAIEWADSHPSDETIMLILNCIGYEEKSWVEFVRKELEKRK